MEKLVVLNTDIVEWKPTNGLYVIILTALQARMPIGLGIAFSWKKNMFCFFLEK